MTADQKYSLGFVPVLLTNVRLYIEGSNVYVGTFHEGPQESIVIQKC